MYYTKLNILLADDDIDDCNSFKQTLIDLQQTTPPAIIHEGNQLMHYLYKNVANLPDVLFLDQNLPLKTGFECLTEIKENEKLFDLPVVMILTSFSRDPVYECTLIKMLLKIGVTYFIRKSEDFELQKLEIKKALIIIADKKWPRCLIQGGDPFTQNKILTSISNV
jgi:CheY-like chemotaxis protein